MITQPAHELTFGPLLLTGPHQTTDWTYSTLGDGMTFGSAEPLEKTLATLLQDGAVVVTQGHGNREPVFLVKIIAEDAISLAEGEKALFLACSRPNTLSWTPPDGVGATSVFDVFTSSLEPVFDDVKELLLQRVYRLRLVCHPFTRSVDLVVDESLPVSETPTSVTIVDGSSAANWVGLHGTVTTSGGFLTVPEQWTSSVPNSDGSDTAFGDGDATYTPASPIDFSDTPYLIVDIRVAAGQPAAPLQAIADSQMLTLISEETIDLSGTRRVGFLVTDPSVASIRFRQYVRDTVWPDPGIPNVSVLIDQIVRTDVPPNGNSTGRSQLRLIEVDGSARTQGSLAVEHPTLGLGDVIVYTSPALTTSPGGYQPELSRWSVGSRTADTDLISGAYETGGGICEVPIGLLPAGGYVFAARLSTDAASPETIGVSWRAVTVVNTTELGETVSPEIQCALTPGEWTNFILPALVLPPVSVPDGSAGVVSIELVTADADLMWDEAWVFYCGDDAALTMLAAGAGTPDVGTVHNRLWIESATAQRPAPGLYVGAAADQSDAFHAGGIATAWGVHSFVPDRMSVYVANSGAPNPAVTLRHYPRWFTHAVR